MRHHKLKLSVQQVRTFLDDYYSHPVKGLKVLQGGEWSQAFAFKQGSNDRVVRFGNHQEDFLKDAFAYGFNTNALPIPMVLAIGKAFNSYYAISERAFGTMIDDLDKPHMRQIISSLFATLDAMRNADIAMTTGYGRWDSSGNAPFESWRSYLLSVVNDGPSSKTHGWKAGLQKSPIGYALFDEAYAYLVKQSEHLPQSRGLIHNDLLHFNVMVEKNRIHAVFDWANALYGDFLYDLAAFTFWEPFYKPVKGFDWAGMAQTHYKNNGVAVPEFDRRLQCYMVHIGLDAQTYYGFTKNWEWLESVATRTLALAKKSFD